MKDAITVTVIGAGLMGHGIGQTFARAGHEVIITDKDISVLNGALARVERNLLDEGVDAERVMCNLAVEPDLSTAVSRSNLVIEAAPERLEIKQAIFAQVAASAPSHAVLASNTSVIPITSIGERLEEKARRRLLGTHWWNPPHLIPLVEVVRTEFTSEEVVEQTCLWLKEAGKLPVKVKKDITGFIGNRLQLALWREAIALVDDDVCDAEAIDLVVKNSFGLRLPVLGPMENLDLVGLELARDVQRVMFPDLKCNPQPSKILDRLIEQGCTGMKAGEGFRKWSQAEAEAVHKKLAKHLLESTQPKS